MTTVAETNRTGVHMDGDTVTTYQKEDAVGIALRVPGRDVVLVRRSTRPGVLEGDRGWENSMETGASRA